MEYTGSEDFKTKFTELVADTSRSNTERATAVENFLLSEAVTAGVVKEITITSPKNPNKWGKTLAPWFNEKCREAKRAMANARRQNDRNDECCIAATRAYLKICL